MRKSTKNKLTKAIHVILIILTVFIALIASLYAAIRDVTVQSMIVRSAAGIVSQKLNTEVKIKTFYITPNLEIHVDGVQINDLDKYPMFEIGEFRTKLAFGDKNAFRLKEVYLKDALGRLVTYEGDEQSNLSEMISRIPKSEKKDESDVKSDFRLAVDDIKIENAHFILWNQNRDDPARKRMDYKHLDVENINITVDDFSFGNDTITGNIRSLSAKERCGLVINSFSTNLMFCPADIILDDLLIDLNDSHLDLDLEFKYNDADDFDYFVDSVVLISNIRDTHLNLSDIRFWSDVMRKMPDNVVLNADFKGIVNDFTVENLDLSFGECSNIKGYISIKDVSKNDFNISYWDVDFPDLVTSYDDLVNFYIPSSSVTIPIPEAIKSIGNVALSVDFKGTPVDFDFSSNIKTEIGRVNAELNLYENAGLPEYDANIVTYDFDMTEIIGTKDPAKITMAMHFNGNGTDAKDVDLKGLARVKSLEIKENVFGNFNFNLSMKDETAKVNTRISDSDIDLKLEAWANLKGGKPVFDAVAKIRNANLSGLHLIESDSVMLLSTNLDVSFSGFSLDELVADVNIDSTSYFDGKDYYRMNHLNVSLSDFNGIKTSTINCDFFDFQADGIVHFNTFVDAMKNTVLAHVQLPALKEGGGLYKVDKQEFAMKLDLKRTDMLTKLFLPKLRIAPGTSLTATFTTEGAMHGQDFECPEMTIGGVLIKDIGLRNSIDNERITSEFTVRDLILRDSTDENSSKINLENIVFSTLAQNDSVFFNLDWDNFKTTDRNTGDISAVFVPNDLKGGLLSVSSNGLVITDTLLIMDDGFYIDFQGDKTIIDNFNLHTKQQSIKINGEYPNKVSDTINVSFHQLDLSDLNIFLVGENIELDGVIDGDASLSGMKEQLSFASGLFLDKLLINGRYVGDVSLDSYWNDPDESIAINAKIISERQDGSRNKTFELLGNYYALRENDNLKLNLNVNDFRLHSVEPLVKSVIGKMDGELNGSVDISGSLAKPVLEGYLALHDAGCKINFLNTYYKINDTVRLSENLINFESLELLDTLGNNATVTGNISHNYLKDFNLDINLECDNFAAMNIPADKASGFYGSAIADGNVAIKGPFDDIFIDIDIDTQKGTEISIPISSQSTVDDNFIVFVEKKIDVDTLLEVDVPESVKASNLTLNLDANVNTDAKLNIVLPSNMGNISATGDGNVNLGMKSGNLTLKGNYLINSGSFAFNLQVASRVFNIRKGGTISFNGNPTDADIDIVSSFRTKASLKTIGGGIDTTMVDGNVTVDCILRLQNKLMNPTITFGLEFPSSKEDVKTAVFAVIDTTNQNVMAQHVLSLMVLGSFANSGVPALANMGTAAYYKVITGALNNWLSQLSKNFDIGVNYKPFSNFTNEEIEVALSTQLFDERLTVEGNFGVIRGTDNTAGNANNIVGDIDVTYKLSKRLSLKAYNHTNTNNNSNYYFYENISDYTQGLGISLSQNFDRFSEIFMKQKKNNDKKKDKKDKKNKKDSENNENDIIENESDEPK